MELSNQEVTRRLNNTRPGSLWEALDITVVSAERERVVLTMPIGPQHKQQAGYLHGGVSVLLAETAASIGTALNIDLERQMTFGIEINANHLRPKRAGQLTVTATPIHRGRTTQVWDIRITDELEKLVCVSRCTLAVVPRAPEASNPLLQSQAGVD
jgi:1,4-dihydroxy-2-naphthoyl-CoA hydrolase